MDTPIQQRRKDLSTWTNEELCDRLLSLNPFGGYTIAETERRREQTIETIIRYEWL